MNTKCSIIALTAILLAVFWFQPTNSAVIGLDLGSEYLKASSISPGKSFYIIEDTTTKRKTPTAIGFYNNERIWEYDTIVKRPRAYQTSFSNLVKYLGKHFGDEKLVAKSKHLLEDYITEENERGGVSFGLKTFKMSEDDETTYKLSVEELFGMIFRHVKDLAAKQTDLNIRDIVVTVPPYWAFKERYALNDALLLADLNPLAFINENTAAALYYALERQDEKTHTVLFYNLGSSDLKVSLIEFFQQNSTDKADKGAKVESYRVLADAWLENVGGLTFDVNLLNHFAKEFDSKPNRAGKKSILTSNPAKAKILKEVNRLKEILSANKQASIYLENVFDSTDLKSSIDRTKFDEINAELYTQLTKPIDEVLTKAGKTIQDVDVVELIGGGIRVPRISQLLSEHLQGKEIGTHLNGDESQTLGASFHAANLSASFKTRQIYLSDGYNWDVRLELKDLDEAKAAETNEDGEPTGLNKNAVLFPTKTRFGSKKILTFEHSGDVNASFYARLPGSEQEEIITTFAITGLPESLQHSKYKGKELSAPRIHLSFKLSNMGFIELTKAEAHLEEIILYQPNVTNTTSSKTAELSDDTDDVIASIKAADKADISGDAATEDQDKKLKKKKINHYIPLRVEQKIAGVNPMSEDQLEKSRDLLSKFDHSEEIKKKTSEAKSKLESYLYTTRDYLEDEAFSAHAKEEEKARLREMLTEFDDWLFGGEGSRASHHTLTKKFEEIYSPVTKIYHRLEQKLKRPEIIQKAKDIFADMLQKIGELNATKPWITDEAKSKAIQSIEDAKTWLNEMVEKQEAHPTHEDPVLTTTHIQSKMEKVKEVFNKVKNTVKPSKPKNGTATPEGGFTGFENFMGPDGKIDQEKLREYMKKMNITLNDTKETTEENKTEDDGTKIPTDEAKVEDQPEEPKEETRKPDTDL